MAGLCPQYFKFKDKDLVFAGCVATKRPMLTSNDDIGHGRGGVFKQVKGDCISSSPLSRTERQVGMAEAFENFCYQADPPFCLPSLCMSSCLPAPASPDSPLTDKPCTILSHPSSPTLSFAWSGLSLPLSLPAQLTNTSFVQPSQMLPSNLPPRHPQPLTQGFITATREVSVTAP